MFKNFVFIVAFFLSLFLFAQDKGFSEDLFDDIPFDSTSEKSIPFAASNTGYASSLGEKIEDFRDFNIYQNSFSILGATENIGSISHLSLFPNLFVSVPNFSANFGVPLRFRVYDASDLTRSKFERKQGFVSGKNFITPRPMDFVSFWDVQRLIRKMEFGKSYEDFFLSMDRNRPLSLSQGTLVKNLTPNWFYDQDHIFARGHASFNYVRLDGFVGPLLKAQILGLNFRASPFSTLDSYDFVKNMNFDVTYVGDYQAPNYVQKKLFDGEEVFLLDDEHRLVERNKGMAQGVAVTFLSNYMPDYWLNLKPYTSFSQLLLTGAQKLYTTETTASYGAGFHLGNDFSFYLSQNNPESVVYLTTEGRAFTPHYWPTYFDSTYMLDRTSLNQLASLGPNDQNTKSLILKNTTINTLRLGYLLSLGYSYNDNFYSQISYEDAFATKESLVVPFMRKFRLDLGAKIVDKVKFYINYELYGIEQISKTFDFYDYRKLLSLKCRTEILPYLYADIWSAHKFGVIDMYTHEKGSTYLEGFHWLSENGEVKSLDFGLGLEFAMNF